MTAFDRVGAVLDGQQVRYALIGAAIWTIPWPVSSGSPSISTARSMSSSANMHGKRERSSAPN